MPHAPLSRRREQGRAAREVRAMTPDTTVPAVTAAGTATRSPSPPTRGGTHSPTATAAPAVAPRLLPRTGAAPARPRPPPALRLRRPPAPATGSLRRAPITAV